MLLKPLRQSIRSGYRNGDHDRKSVRPCCETCEERRVGVQKHSRSRLTWLSASGLTGIHRLTPGPLKRFSRRCQKPTLWLIRSENEVTKEENFNGEQLWL